jgi:hypothetical protein
MKRESIFAQIERHERFRLRMEARHQKHIDKGKPRPNTCFHCRLDAAKKRREAERQAKGEQR